VRLLVMFSPSPRPFAKFKLLAGLPDPRLTRAGLDRTATFGALRDHPEPWLTGLLRRCVTAGWVDFTPG